MKKPLGQALLDFAVPPLFHGIEFVLNLVTSVQPHSLQAGFNDVVDELRLKTIRAKLARGQRYLPATCGEFLLSKLPSPKLQQAVKDSGLLELEDLQYVYWSGDGLRAVLLTMDDLYEVSVSEDDDVALIESARLGAWSASFMDVAVA